MGWEMGRKEKNRMGGGGGGGVGSDGGEGGGERRDEKQDGMGKEGGVPWESGD